MKLYIAGAPGSGKSTLARELAARLDLPCFELDEILYTADDRKRLPDEYGPLFEAALARDEWIVEGVPRKKFARALEEADQIVSLDFPKRIILCRAVARWAKQRLGLEPSRYAPTWRMLRQMLGWIRSYDGATLARYEGKCLCVRTKQEWVLFLKGIKE